MNHRIQFGFIPRRESHVDRFNLPEMINYLFIRRFRGKQTVNTSNVPFVLVLRLRFVPNADRIPFVKQYVANTLLDLLGAFFSMVGHELPA